MKYDGIDWLRGIAAFGIVGCHLALTPMNDVCWRIHDLCDMNVGLFAAVSGFLMWKPDGFGGLASYVRKRCSRLLPVYFVWTLVFIAFGFVFDLFVRHGINEKWLDWSYYPKVVFGGQASAHLWFLICLFYVQIVVAMFSKVLQLLGGWILLVLGFAVVFLASHYMDVWFFGYPIRMLGFVLTGYALRCVVAQSNIASKQCFLLWLCVSLVTAVAHYLVRPCQIPAFIKDWCLIIPLMLAFVSMPKLASVRLSRIGLLLGDTSMGVYLVHPIITAGFGLFVRRVFHAPYNVYAFVFDLCCSYFTALLISVVLNRIRPVAKFVR